MKKMTFYISAIAMICIIMSAGYYLSYKHALREFNERMILRSDEFDRELNAAIQQTDINNMVSNENVNVASRIDSSTENEVIEVGLSDSDRIHSHTKYILETYNQKIKTRLIEELAVPAEFIGMNRDELTDYLAGYMSDMPVKEYTEGLIAYELAAFSSKELTIRKTYNEDTVPYKFYLSIRDGYVVIYYSDLKTIYEHTQIQAINLPEEERNLLVSGYYVKDMDELYSILEAYTS